MKGLLGMAKQKKKEQILKPPPQSMFQPGKRLPYQAQDDYEDQGQIMDQDMDEDYQPSQQEILEYAAFLGIDPIREKDLMYIAKEGLIAPLPAQWKPFQTKTKQIYYVNLQTGEKIWEHPCDEYYQQLVMKERAKKMNKEIDSKAKAREIKNQDKPLGIQIKPKPKPTDPLLKLEQQKKMKKMEEQKKAQFEKRKAQLDKEYQNKKDDIIKTNRSKQQTMRNKHNKQQDELTNSHRQKISEKHRSQQSKFQTQLDQFRKQLKQSLESTYSIRLKAERQSLEQTYKSKREEARRNLDVEFKKKKKAMEEEFAQSMKALEEKEKQVRSVKQEREDNFQKEIEKLRQQHINEKLAQNSHLIDEERATQEIIYNAEVQKLMEEHNKKIASIEKQTTSTTASISLQPFVKELEDNYQKQVAALSFELNGIRQLRETQMQQKIAEFQLKLQEAHQERIMAISDDYKKKTTRQKQKADRQFQLRVSTIQKKANDDYIRSLNDFQSNFQKQQGVLLQHYQNQRLLRNDQQSTEQQQLNRLNKQLQRLQDQSVKYKKILSNLELQCDNSKSHLEREQSQKGSIYGKLNSQQKDLYDLIGDKERENFRREKDVQLTEL